MSLTDEPSGSPWKGREDELDAALRELLSYSADSHSLCDHDVEILINAIDSCKVLDPACGSGAFPMGVLHKLVHVIHKLDPRNARWKKRQIHKARQIDDPSLRDRAVADIEEAFEANDLDYGRKLFLIENCIYGIDIQPIAVQIAKLRFFISLIIDERPGAERENLGIRSLPNLETKFVAADSLIALERHYDAKAGETLFRNADAIIRLEQELRDIRHSYFSAKTRGEKLRCRKMDREKRECLANELAAMRFSEDDIDKLKSFDPYDQNRSAPFFDAEWMFGVRRPDPTNGVFDIVIGNPPYVQIQNFSGRPEQAAWARQGYSTFTRTGDVYCLFYEKGFRLLRQNGVLSYITSNKWMRANYGKTMRRFFLDNGSISRLIDFGDSPIFESATTYTDIVIWQKAKPGAKPRVWDLTTVYEADTTLESLLERQEEGEPLFSEDAFVIASGGQGFIKKRIEEVGVPLKEWGIQINYGIKTGFNEAFIISGKKKDELIARDPKSAEILRPILRGRDIKRYRAEFADLWLISTFPALHLKIRDYPAIQKHLKSFGKRLEQSGEKGCRKKTSNKWFEVQDTIAYYPEFEKEKIIIPALTSEASFLFDNHGYYGNDKTTIVTGEGLKYLSAVINSRLLWSYMMQISSTKRGGFFEVKPMYIGQLPVPQVPSNRQLPFETLVDCILFAKSHNIETEATLFESVIDGMVFDLYFPDEMKKAHCYITDRVAEVIKPFTKDDSQEFKTEYIQQLYSFFKKDKTVYHGLIHRRTVKPVEIVMGAYHER